VNLVRARAATASTWVSSGANYVINIYPGPWTNQVTARNAVRFERKLELAMEGHRFFDLVRWEVADVVLNAFLAYEKGKLAAAYSSATAGFVKGKNEYFPIPQRQIDLEVVNGTSALEQNPGYN
jgi:hypothetical protein